MTTPAVTRRMALKLQPGDVIAVPTRAAQNDATADFVSLETVTSAVPHRDTKQVRVETTYRMVGGTTNYDGEMLYLWDRYRFVTVVVPSE